MSKSTQIRFRDLPRRNELAINELRLRREQLKQRTGLTDEDRRELKRIEELLARIEATPKLEVADPLFVSVRDYFNDDKNAGLLGKTVLNFDEVGHLLAEKTVAAGNVQKIEFSDVVRIALVLGLLAADGPPPPRLRHVPTCPSGDAEIRVDETDPINAGFARSFYAAYGEAKGAERLAELVLSILDEEGDPSGNRNTYGEVETLEFAQVLRCLQEKGITADEPQLRRRVNECLDRIQSVGVDKPLKDIGIALPDLNETAAYDIQTENVKLMGAVICSAMFEELKVFQVVDKLVELAQNGMLPIGRGSAGETLYKYWRDTPNRMSEMERRNFYALTIGIPGGDAAGMVNREFNDLWIRFVSSVSSLVRQKTADQLLRASIPAGVSQQQVRKSARDLAQNLSLHGYGMSVFYALELQGLINTVIDLLRDREIMGAYGARDMWQVIDQVATLELGGARNSIRYRTLASCGAIITAWLANNVKRYNQATSNRVINVEEVLSLDPPSAGAKATTDPTDYDLVNACELWLADTATSDERIEELSQPREAPMMTSRPVQIPAIARDMLEQAGIPGLGLGLGMGRR